MGSSTPPVSHWSYVPARHNHRAYGYHQAPSGVWWCGICNRIIVRGRLHRRWWERPTGWVQVVGDISNMPYESDSHDA